MLITRKYYAKDEKPVLTAEQKERLAALKDRPIDLSDAPEQLDWSYAVRGRLTKKACLSMMTSMNGYKKMASLLKYV